MNGGDNTEGLCADGNDLVERGKLHLSEGNKGRRESLEKAKMVGSKGRGKDWPFRRARHSPQYKKGATACGCK